MKTSKRPLVGVLAMLLMAGTAYGNPDLAKQKNCMACHAIDKKLVGPALKDVAAKYEGNDAALDTLTQKVLKGTVGTWGQIPMPANTQLTADEARLLVQWVLSLK